jgi:hypothetical protein
MQNGLGFGEMEGGGAIGSAASVEETYFLDLRSVGVKNVKDFVFLHGKGQAFIGRSSSEFFLGMSA